MTRSISRSLCDSWTSCGLGHGCGQHRIHRSHQCQYETDGMSQHRLLPFSATMHRVRGTVQLWLYKSTLTLRYIKLHYITSADFGFSSVEIFLFILLTLHYYTVVQETSPLLISVGRLAVAEFLIQILKTDSYSFTDSNKHCRTILTAAVLNSITF